MPRGTETAPARVGFSIPKKKFRSSVHRHRVRRLIFESWRLHKHLLYAHVPPHLQLHLFIMYTDNKMPDYTLVEPLVVKGITKLAGTMPEVQEHA
jgi:ribonuclease P protein component